MAIKTYTQQLENVQAAIEAIESGAQSYMIGDRQMTKANLATLYEREKMLRIAVARESRGGIKVRGGTPVV